MADVADPLIPIADREVIMQETYTKLHKLYWASYEGRLADNFSVSHRLSRLRACEAEPAAAGQVFERALSNLIPKEQQKILNPTHFLTTQWLACSLRRVNDAGSQEAPDSLISVQSRSTTVLLHRRSMFKILYQGIITE